MAVSDPAGISLQRSYLPFLVLESLRTLFEKPPNATSGSYVTHLTLSYPWLICWPRYAHLCINFCTSALDGNQPSVITPELSCSFT
jgi:hypothetical protein